MSIAEGRPLILGSSSPRRREILSGLGIPIRVSPAAVDESVRAGEAPEQYLERIAESKLAAAASAAGDAAAGGLLVADTIVVIDGAILGKPDDVPSAERMLAKLCGRTHVVFTRYAIAAPARLATVARARTVRTEVTLRAASVEEIRGYARTGEGLDKAGAYAAQGIGSFLVERIAGSYSNVVGLPACEVIVDLKAAGLLASYP